LVQAVIPAAGAVAVVPVGDVVAADVCRDLLELLVGASDGGRQRAPISVMATFWIPRSVALRPMVASTSSP